MSIQAAHDGRQFSILFVDDEEKTLKYFNRAFSAEMDIITASSAEEAMDILSERADNIGVLITDQRMPNQNGVDLLKHVKRRYPGITRILTTAYTELDDAIAAVNSGEIFRYITKPWDIRILRGELLRAMDYFIAQHERDLLVKEKLGVWAKLSYTNHLRDLLVMSAGFSHVRYPLHAIYTYLSQFSEILSCSYLATNQKVIHTNIWDSMLVDISDMHGLTKYILQVTNAASTDSGFDHELDINDYLREMVEEIGDINKADISLETGGAPALINADRMLIKRLFRLLLESLFVSVKPGSHFSLRVEKISDISNVAGMRVAMTTDSGSILQGKQQDGIVVAEFQRKMLAAFFICFHHGGNIQYKNNNTGLSLDVFLPIEPAKVILKEPGDNWLRIIMEQYENRMIFNNDS